MWDISSSLADFLFDLSNVVLVLGAAAVLIGTIGSIKMAGIKERFSNERIAANEAETAKAVAESDSAKAEVAKAQLALEKYKGPRNITAEDLRKMEGGLSRYRATPYDLSIPLRLEPGSFLINQLIATLRKSGWEIRSFKGSVTKAALSPTTALFAIEAPTSNGPVVVPHIEVATNIGVLRGVLITFDLKSAALSDAVYALNRSLNAADILSEAYVAPTENGQADDVIHITIGTKP
jgi:hypothetical protein